MSWYTTGEILIWLILAALLGFILGWLIRGLRKGKSTGDADVQALRDENASLSKQLDDCKAARAKLEAGAKTAPANVVRPESADQAREMVASQIATRTAGEGEIPKDDLEEVFGIGPVISKMLYGMGITSFRQVARFTPQDVATVESALEFFPDRIVRDDWMSSARKLHIEKYGSDPLKN